jgi:hypothetical protein
MGTVSLLDGLTYLDLLAEVRPEKLERAAIRWHGRLETEAPADGGDGEKLYVPRVQLIRG